jgi:cytochrome c oxidase accessory protein FixG
VSFAFMSFLTGVLLFDFGWFREQFCAVVCPYGRFQSVLMNSKSTTVLYDVARGEPRRGWVTPGGKPQGDCVDCKRCVTVCPTGIDIRNGLQMECVACTACIDACDDVMTRLKKPRGLIRYESHPGAFKRALPQFAILVAVAAGLAFQVSRREPIQASLIRAVEAPYQLLSGEGANAAQVLNHYRLDLRNQTFENQNVQLELSDELRAQGFEIVTPTPAVSLDAGQSSRTHLFFKFPKSALREGKAQAKLKLRVSSELTLEREVVLVGPYL